MIVNRKVNEIRLVKLTVPWDTTSSMEAALIRKTERYNDLTNSIQANGFKCFNLPLEIGVMGVINGRNRGLITNLCHIMGVRKVTNVTKLCSKLALLGSYTIWNARHSQDWSGAYINP